MSNFMVQSSLTHFQLVKRNFMEYKLHWHWKEDPEASTSNGKVP